MTATFGKLEHETLTLQPGLNILEAPNEWGKSTWCAFIVAMLYGLDTRAHSTKTALADKERYAPWSGSPMSGSMDIDWNGRKITIQRRTRGRAVLGDFQARETETGLSVPELTAANCGQVLLGVEKDVFLRAGFLRLTDLPVTQNDALRRRLNALVTTGDESGAGDDLMQKLKELRNSCRYNRTGLLPQAEKQRDDLLRDLRELEAMQTQSQSIRRQLKELDTEAAALQNHKDALAFEKYRQSRRNAEVAAGEKENAARKLRSAEDNCAGLPPEGEIQQSIETLQALQQRGYALQGEAQRLPPAPQPPQTPAPFQGASPEDALAQVRRDTQTYQAQSGSKAFLPWVIFGVLSAAAAMGLLFTRFPFFAAIPFGLLVLCAAAAMRLHGQRSGARNILEVKYGSADPALWQALAEQYCREQQAYADACAACDAARQDLNGRQQALLAQIASLTHGTEPAACLAAWQQALEKYRLLAEAGKDFQRAESLAAVTLAAVKEVSPPRQPDDLPLSDAETDRRLSDTRTEQRRLHITLGQCVGRMEQLGDGDSLRTQLDAVNARIEKLEDTYAALSIAIHTLTDATAELQRRFAPRISSRAQELFARLTGGRYDRLTLSEDLRLNAGAQEEDTLRSYLWRSDGTVDQLYLALRLAVAEELTPDAPLILDDALVRFDDRRLTAALEILREEANTRQVILFTCQSREARQ